MIVAVLVVYVFAALFGWLQARLLDGIVQRAMNRLRVQVEDKIHRLPLSYFDRVNDAGEGAEGPGPSSTRV